VLFRRIGLLVSPNLVRLLNSKETAGPFVLLAQLGYFDHGRGVVERLEVVRLVQR
jgi:hypothetical protein